MSWMLNGVACLSHQEGDSGYMQALFWLPAAYRSCSSLSDNLMGSPLVSSGR